ncbi:MAG: hypothetical protein HUJ93_05835, partial [Bacteroidales bacterium]|nr:hypothetical protein [Bacteroidales bacterium]
MKKLFLVLILLVSGCLQTLAQNALCKFGDVNPLDIEFKRLAVRRFIFSNNIPLNEFVPSEIVSFSSMHPAFKVSETESLVCDREFSPKIEKGKLVLDQDCGKEGVAFFAGGVNPYAVYEVDIESIAGDAEVGVELAATGLRNRVQVYAGSSPGKEGIYIRIYCNGAMEREVRCTDSLPEGAFVLRMQSYGKAVAVYIEQYGESVLVGRIADKENFSRIIDFRDIKTAGNSTFNVISNLKGRAVVGGARSYLSTGIGQADIRLISYEDLSPYFYEDRLWFTFSIRGIDICQSAQGILSLDPSVFDPKLEGVVVFDHGDGLLRNDYSSHLFFDRTDNQWKAVACDFGGTAGE